MSVEKINLVLDAINLYQTQYTQVDKLWGYFSVVSLAVVGFVVGREKVTQKFNESVIIIIAYMVFCYGNHLALIEGQAQLQQFYDIVVNLAVDTKLNVSTMEPFSTQDVKSFHLSVVGAISIGILLVSWFRHKALNKKTSADAALTTGSD